MSRRGVFVVLAALVPLITAVGATAQAIKEVEVINFPDPQNVVGAVEVTNLPAVQDVNVVGDSGSSCEVERFQLVGFTAAVSNGVLGGPWGANAMCQA